MSQHEYYLISDIHLERKNEYKKQFLLESINSMIENNKNKGKDTIVVFAGDVNNGTEAYDWLKKINTKIIYIAGNHEFWKNDYYETLNSLQIEAPKNVTFLHNEFVEMGDYIIIGSTMWTDVGKSLNDTLKYVSNGLMNDNYNITAKQWYNNKNIEKLKKISPTYNFDNMVEKKGWNILIEQEENEQTINFFQDFAIIRNQLLKFREELLSSEKDLNNKYLPISKEKYAALQSASQYEKYTYKQWLEICKEHNLLGYEEISDNNLENISKGSEEIFSRLTKMNFNKKLLVVSHHLPFLEERLIGYYSHTEKSKKLYNEKADSPIYTVRDGLNDYPHHNYFYRITKGDFSRDESIVEAVHYSNNGAINLPEYFLKDIHAWCHGHDHTMNYQDFVKSVPILTNPMSYSLDVFIFSEKGIHLNESYKKYHKIDTEEKEVAEVQKLRSLVLRPISFNTMNNKEEMIKLWVLSLMDFETIYGLIENFSQNNKKAFTYLAKNPRFALGEITDKQYQKIQEFMFSNYYHYNELKKQLNTIDLAYAARKDIEFSYMNKVNQLYKKEISEYFFGESRNIQVENFSKELLEDYGYDYMSSQLFKNIYHLNKTIKRMKHLESILKQLGEVNSITELFNKNLPDIYPKEPKMDIVFDRDLEQKKRKIMEKYVTEEIENEKQKRYKDNYDF